MHQLGARSGMAVANNIERLREARGWKRPELARRMDTSPQQIERLEKGQRRLTQDWIERAAEAFGIPAVDIITPLPDADVARTQPGKSELGDEADFVTVQQVDFSYGLGATFADGHSEVELLRFPRAWLETITYSPPALLTWARGKGDSMAPTIHDGDLVLLDRSQRRVTEQDALWAYTVGDLSAIKRLRMKGDRVVILSDNANVPPDEELAEHVNIVARVIFIGKRS